MSQLNLKDVDFDGLQQALQPVNCGRTPALKIFASVFAHGAKSMDDVRAAKQVPATVRDYVQRHGTLPSLSVVERRQADDGFVKYLFESPLGGRFEAVRIPIFDTKYVVCVSSQVGCALACDFCMTGKLGFKRNLQSWEILEQVMQVRADADRPVRGVVFMGMGEPLLNFDQATKAARVMCHPAGLAISGKSITFSTAGWVPGIRRYLKENLPYRLAFSLTSAIPEKRLQVLPVEKTWPLSELVPEIKRYALERDERAMLAYVCISGFNMGREDAEAIARTFEGVPIKLDLIDVTDPTGTYLPPTADELAAFRDHLQVVGAPIARRYSGGKDIGAACGTLAATQSGGTVLTGGDATAIHPERRGAAP